MGRLIDADAFDKRIRLAVGSCEEELTEDFKDGILTILDTMKTAPPVDAVEVVRCKDCKWYGYYSCEMGGNNWMRDGNGFCDRGERKDGDHEKAD